MPSLINSLDDTPPENRQEERPAAPEKEENAGRRLRVTSRTDVGLVRKNNQDAVILGQGLMGVADGMGSNVTGIQLFVRQIPYNFYALLTVVFVVAIILMKFDYGPMLLAEERASVDGDLGAVDSSDEDQPNAGGSVFDLLLPVIVLVLAVFGAMVYAGGFFGTDASGGTDYAGDFVGAFGNTDAFVALPWGGTIALVFTAVFLMLRKRLSFKEVTDCIPKGFIAMVPSILILVLATSLKTMTSMLGAAEFVHGAMQGIAAGLYAFLPAVIFAVALGLAFATGTSWGTFGVLIPIVVAIFPQDSPLLIVGISACCAGAVCGDHCSPISDTTVMATAGALTEHVLHVSTQLPYALTVAGISFATYILAGFVQNAPLCLAFGTVLTIATLFGIRRVTT